MSDEGKNPPTNPPAARPPPGTRPPASSLATRPPPGTGPPASSPVTRPPLGTKPPASPPVTRPPPRTRPPASSPATRPPLGTGPPASPPATRPLPGARPRPLLKPKTPVYEAIGGQKQQLQFSQSSHDDRRRDDVSKLQRSPSETSDVSPSGRAPPPIPTTPRPALTSQSATKPPPPPTTPPPRLRAATRNIPVRRSINQSEPLPNSVNETTNPLTPEPEEPLSLSEFVTRHSSSLPLRVRVDKGFCGAEERCVISAGDIYNLHFIKRTRVVSMRDGGNCQYTIPLNSAIEFGPLYNPNRDVKEAFDGYMFDTVAEILALKGPLPKLLRVTRSHQGSDPKSSVREGELLIVRKASRTMMMRKPVLKVFSVTTKEEKALFEDCIGQFTTHPYSAHTFLPEMLQQIPDPFPMEAMLYISSETSDDLPVHLTSEVVNLTHESVETSLIATSCWEGSSVPSEEENIPIEIPIHLDIEVAIVPSEERQNQRLFSDTRDLYETFDPSKVMSYKDTPSGNEYAAQSTIYRAVRYGYEREGLELEKPALVYENPSLLKRSEVTACEKRQDKTSSPTVENKPSPLLSAEKKPAPLLSSEKKPSPLPSSEKKPSPLPALEKKPSPLLALDKKPSPLPSSEKKPSPLPASEKKPSPLPVSEAQPEPPLAKKPMSPIASRSNNSAYPSDIRKEVSALQSSHNSLKAMVEALQDSSDKQFASVRAEMSRASAVMDSTSKQLAVFQAELAQLSQLMRASSEASLTSDGRQPRGEDQAAVEERNRTALRTLTHAQILDLLTAMNLEQYREAFICEQIVGDILAECDESVLEYELGVASKLHRTRLMKMVSGRRSAVAVLESQDPYVALTAS